MHSAFGGFYRGKRVLITGHTGFKGSWLASWLHSLGATVVGYALDPPTEPSNFVASRLPSRISHISGDVREFESLANVFQTHRPEIVFHLAAQAIVRRSLHEPRLTFEVNLMGTVNVLEAARHTDAVRSVVMITTDKCYQNHEWEWGYRETDELGGYDAYGASKACAEVAIAAYRNVRFQRITHPGSELAISSVRAGNVVGGGDWALDRIVPDTCRAIASGQDILVRSPRAVRPWQHVLEPLSGYLWLGALMAKEPDRYRSAWNFGPQDSRVVTVQELVEGIRKRWPESGSKLVLRPDTSEAEALLLRLDCSKAKHRLKWHSTWDIESTLDAIVAWYKHFYRDGDGDMYEFALHQIEEYTACARRLGLAWAQE